LRQLDRTPAATRQSRPDPSRRAARHFPTYPITPLTADRKNGLRLSVSGFAIRQMLVDALFMRFLRILAA
ncbi:MAG TPA: hypothetical protein VIJ17_06855, partial [Pseudolabrys sp.]